MKFDQSAAETKSSQMREAAMKARRSVSTLSTGIINDVLEAFAQVTPPQEPELTIGLVTISSLYTSPQAQSRKPGNVLLNWRKLIDIVPDVSLAGLGAATLPVAPGWSIVLAGLYIWSKVSRSSTEVFSDIEAIVILAFWKNKNSDNKIPEAEEFTRANELRASYSLQPLTHGQYASAVDRLTTIDCLELEDGIIWLREWVRSNIASHRFTVAHIPDF
ncbi:MAG: hypothetical protein SGJ20_01345 [Planctomycetota bacterium]|nr:hypothetical protein [Planctomycetota bacterium]